jgi:hypothetical protein
MEKSCFHPTDKSSNIVTGLETAVYEVGFKY